MVDVGSAVLRGWWYKMEISPRRYWKGLIRDSETRGQGPPGGTTMGVSGWPDAWPVDPDHSAHDVACDNWHGNPCKIANTIAKTIEGVRNCAQAVTRVGFERGCFYAVLDPSFQKQHYCTVPDTGDVFQECRG